MRASGLFLGILLIVFTPLAAFSKDTEDRVLYTIRSVSFKIKGVTRERILRQKANIAVGTEFATLEEFEHYLEQCRQTLQNERVLADVKVEYTLEKGDPGRIFIDITFITQDSWNIIALPYFKYDSNDGLVLSLRGRDYNFLGSMQTLVLNIDYAIDQLERHSYGGLVSMNIPFQLASHDANVSIYEDLAVHADGRPTSSISNLGFSIVLPTRSYPITLNLNQGFQSNPDEVDDDIDPYFLVSSLTASSWIPTSLSAGQYGQVSYTPGLTASLNWRPGKMVRDDRKGFKLTFSHGLHFGRIDWVNNMRRGMEGHLTNTVAYNFLTGAPTLDFDGTYVYHATKGGNIGFEARFVGFYSFTDTTRTDLGVFMRGIIDERLHGGAAAFLNLQMPVKLFDFPTHLILRKNWFDFELQMTPFVDLGYCRRNLGDALSDSLWYTAGLEFCVYPLRMRTFIVRASAALDLDAVIKNKSLTTPSPRDGYSPYEIFFGLGLFF